MNVRQQHILDVISKHKQVAVKHLVTETAASPATIRRDLQLLEQSGRIERFHGGAKLSPKNRFEQSFARRAQINIEQKQYIASIAANLVSENESIMLGAGTTALYLARTLAQQDKSLQLITNNLFIIQEAANFVHMQLSFLGGNLDYAHMESNGPTALENIQNHVVDKVFIGVNGLSPEHGGTSVYEHHASLYRAMTKVARDVIVIADSTKFETRASYIAVPLHRFSCLVTDQAAKPSSIEAFLKQGIEVYGL